MKLTDRDNTRCRRGMGISAELSRQVADVSPHQPRIVSVFGHRSARREAATPMFSASRRATARFARCGSIRWGAQRPTPPNSSLTKRKYGAG